MAGPNPNIFIEWSPNLVTAWNPAMHASHSGVNLDTLPEKGPREALIALSRRTSFVKAVRVPDVTKGDVLQALRITAGQHLPLAVQEVSFDVHLLSDKTMEGRLSTLVAVRSEDLKTLLGQAKQAGFKPVRVLPVAWGSVLIAERQGLHQAVVIQQTTEGLAIDLVEHGGLKYSRLVPDPNADIFAEIERTCSAANSPVHPVIAAGGISYAQATHRVEQSSLQALSLHPEKLDLNLELQDMLFERAKRQRENMTRSAVALAIAALGVLGAVYYEHQSKEAAAKKEQASWQATLKRKTSLKGSVLDEAQRTQGLVSRLKQSLDPGQRLGDALVTASNLLPEGAWLTGIGAERGKPLLIRGTAKTSDIVANYVQSLSDNPRFRNVQLVFANQGTLNQTNIVNFSVSASAVGNLPLGDVATKTK